MPKKPKIKNSSKSSPALHPESRSAEAATVLWVFSCLATLLAEIILIGFFILSQAKSPLAHLFLFISLVTGCLSLLLLPLVIRIRVQPPPRVLVIISILIAVPPITFVVIDLLLWLPKILEGA